MTQSTLTLMVFTFCSMLSACSMERDFEAIDQTEYQEINQEAVEATATESESESEQNTQMQGTQTANEGMQDSSYPQIPDGIDNTNNSSAVVSSDTAADSSSSGNSDTSDTTGSNDQPNNSEDSSPVDTATSTDDTNNETSGSVTQTSFSQVHSQVIQSKCVACHRQTSIASQTDLIFSLGQSEVEFNNKDALDGFLSLSMDNAQIIKDKARGLSQHGGGTVLAVSSSEYTLWAAYIDSITQSSQPNAGSETDNNQEQAEVQQGNSYTIESQANTYRRASLILTGHIPAASTLEEIDQLNPDNFTAALHNLLQGDGFHEFIKTSANDQLLVRRLVANAYREIGQGLEKHYSEYKGIATNNDKRDELAKELEEEPLELIAYVIENDRPYSEILTANYTLASIKSARLFKATEQSNPTFKPVQNLGQSLIMGRFTDFNSDSLTQIPHAGLLTSYAYLNKYPTTATNRNRARASATLKHFLGFDVEDSSARKISNDALSDSENPTMNNPACTVCHQTLDPIAGAFQNFGSQGIFRDRRYGLYSLVAEYA